VEVLYHLRKVCRRRSGRDQVREGNHERGIHPRSLGVVVDSRQRVRELVEGNGRIYHDLRSIHVEVGFCHGKHHDEGCSHHVEVHGDHSHHFHMDDGQESESELGHPEVRQAGSGGVRTCKVKEFEIFTSATQVTRAPLNSRPSSFSTAVLKSAAVSNSTKLLFC
jgi:hypothetical protein